MAAVLWLPMSVHCQLEKIPALKFLACASDDCSDAQDTDCDDSGCCSAEKAEYKAGQNRVTAPVADAAALPPLDLTDLASAAPAGFSAAACAAVPPDFPTCWQLLDCAACPPRAPTLTS